MNRLSRLIATGCYSGYVPFVPGTLGSGLALGVYWFVPGLRKMPLFLLVGTLFFVGVWAAGRVEKTEGRDASIINVDEIVGMWLALFLIREGASWHGWVGAFVLFRLFDILKPFPIERVQTLPGGWGVMMDDVGAGLYAALSVRVLYWIFLQ